jgi:enterochelin esterase-like enzyme
MNEALHRKLLDRHIRHDYVSRPGAHDAAYWKNAIEYQLLFFYLFFSGKS